MLIAQLAALIMLAIIFIQDIKSRSVYWILFPALITTFFIIKGNRFSIVEMAGTAGINLTFLTMQLLLVTAWFSVKRRALINIMSALLGWGDVLFLICIACYLSVLNFLMFYLGSLFLVLIFWIANSAMFRSNQKHIPLAGLQAFIFLLLLVADGPVTGFDLMADDWLLKLINL